MQESIETYLKRHEAKALLRFITCGSVDDGKSTLIGRLLHDTKMIYEDQLAALERDSAKSGTVGGEIDLALLVDGLQSEREQGITIDVAYRYFSTDRRKFIIADTPGHEQYTRNMATGASTADAAVLLIDARYGVQTQTRRHSFIVRLLGIRHLIIAVNKMDLVDFDADTFLRICDEYRSFAEASSLEEIRFIPISALRGDFVVERGDAPWYDGPTLLEALESIEIGEAQEEAFRFPVQYVNRPHLDFRGYCGTVASGSVRVGDPVTVLPSAKTSRIASIVTYDGYPEEAAAGEAVTLTLEDEIDISRGDLILPAEGGAAVGDAIRAHLVWMSDRPLVPGTDYRLKHCGQSVTARVTAIHYAVDVNTSEHLEVEALPLNGIARASLELTAPICWDPYGTNRTTGNFILIDRLTNDTVGVGMITGAAEAPEAPTRHYSAAEIALNAYIRAHFPEWACRAVSGED